jgi:hypothetical protein
MIEMKAFRNGLGNPPYQLECVRQNENDNGNREQKRRSTDDRRFNKLSQGLLPAEQRHQSRNGTVETYSGV